MENGERTESFDTLFNETDQSGHQPKQKQPFDKEAWAQKQKEQREILYDQADGMADRVLSEQPDALIQYLTAQARLGKTSVTNTLLLMEQCPNASRVHSFEEWQQRNRSVKRDEKASLTLMPGREYVKDDGTTGVSYNVKRVFDVRQTHGKPLKQPPVHPLRSRLKALMTDTPVPVRLSDAIPQGIGAEYMAEQNTVEVARGLDGDMLFFTVARELARAESKSSTFVCDCAANILCNRYGMAPQYSDIVPEEYVNLEPQGKREVLANIRQTACTVMERMDRSLAHMIQPQDKGGNQPQR